MIMMTDSTPSLLSIYSYFECKLQNMYLQSIYDNIIFPYHWKNLKALTLPYYINRFIHLVNYQYQLGLLIFIREGETRRWVRMISDRTKNISSPKTSPEKSKIPETIVFTGIFIDGQRRGRDSNPRRLAPQRFSRPPQSTTLPPLHE